MLIVKCMFPGCESSFKVKGPFLGNRKELKCPNCGNTASPELYKALIELAKCEDEGTQKGFCIRYEGDFE